MERTRMDTVILTTTERNELEQHLFRGHKSVGDQVNNKFAAVQRKLALLEARRSKMKNCTYLKFREKYRKTEDNLNMISMMGLRGHIIHDN